MGVIVAEDVRVPEEVVACVPLRVVVGLAVGRCEADTDELGVAAPLGLSVPLVVRSWEAVREPLGEPDWLDDADRLPERDMLPVPDALGVAVPLAVTEDEALEVWLRVPAAELLPVGLRVDVPV